MIDINAIDPKAVELAKMVNEEANKLQSEEELLQWMQESGIDWNQEINVSLDEIDALFKEFQGFYKVFLLTDKLGGH